jgi:hypothetical protein
MTAIGFLLALMMAGCASGPGPRIPIDLSRIPITITMPPDVAPDKPFPAPAKPKATLAFEVVDVCDGHPIETAFARVTDGPTQQVNADAYAAFELEAAGSIYLVAFDADGYQGSARTFQVDGNRQFPIRLTPTAGCQKPAPPPVPAPDPTPVPPVVVVPAPPVVTTQPLCAMRDSDPLGCVRQVAAVYPHLLQINTFDSTVEFTQRVLEVLGEPWGHVGKTARESGKAIPRGFEARDVGGYWIVGVSHDSIKHRLTGQVVDILGNATANMPCPDDVRAQGKCWQPGPASIGWELVPSHDWRIENPFVPAVPVR